MAKFGEMEVVDKLILKGRANVDIFASTKHFEAASLNTKCHATYGIFLKSFKAENWKLNAENSNYSNHTT